MEIFSGTSNIALSQNLAYFLQAKFVKTKITNYTDREISIEFLEDASTHSAIVVQSTALLVNDYLMELLLLIDAIKNSGRKRVTALIPYFGYSRQDKVLKYNSLPVRLVAKLLESAGADSIITVDLHSEGSKSVFNVPVYNINAASLWAELIKNRHSDLFLDPSLFPVIVSPDKGGVGRAKLVCELLDLDLAIINKTRKADDNHSMELLQGYVKGKHCIIIDDIIDSAGTICKTSELLIEQGALSVDVYATHALFSSSKAKDYINKAPIRNIYVTNTILHDKAIIKNISHKIEVVSIDSILSKEILNLLQRGMVR